MNINVADPAEGTVCPARVLLLPGRCCCSRLKSVGQERGARCDGMKAAHKFSACSSYNLFPATCSASEDQTTTRNFIHLCDFKCKGKLRKRGKGRVL